MAENEPNGLDEGVKDASSYGKYVGLAFQMIAVIGIFTFIGYQIDESTGHATKWVTAVLSLAGVFAALYLVIRSVKK
jgi:F0F1-type ATP synthase assembly protein I